MTMQLNLTKSLAEFAVMAAKKLSKNPNGFFDRLSTMPQPFG